MSGCFYFVRLFSIVQSDREDDDQPGQAVQAYIEDYLVLVSLLRSPTDEPSSYITENSVNMIIKGAFFMRKWRNNYGSNRYIY